MVIILSLAWELSTGLDYNPSGVAAPAGVGVQVGVGVGVLVGVGLGVRVMVGVGEGTPTPEEAHLPVIAVESQQFQRARLSDLRGPAHRLGVCGVHSDWCVLDVAGRLTHRGYQIVLLEDACLWSCPPDVEDHDPALKEIEPPFDRQRGR